MISLCLQSLLLAHDSIAQKDFYPHLPDIPIEVDEDEETVKIVQLVKSNEPLVRMINLSYLFEFSRTISPKHFMVFR